MTATASTPATKTFARPYELSLVQYQHMIESGILTEEDKVELILGQIIEKMPITSEHAATVRRLRHYFTNRFGGKYEISSENPVELPNNSQPEPDCVIALFREDFYVDQHPTVPEIFVVIEVAKSTLYTDRYLKAAAYANGGIQEYWIINLVDVQVEIHLKPNIETSTYSEINQYKPGALFTSPFVGEVNVADLLPEKED